MLSWRLLVQAYKLGLWRSWSPKKPKRMPRSRTRGAVRKWRSNRSRRRSSRSWRRRSSRRRRQTTEGDAKRVRNAAMGKGGMPPLRNAAQGAAGLWDKNVHFSGEGVHFSLSEMRLQGHLWGLKFAKAECLLLHMRCYGKGGN